MYNIHYITQTGGVARMCTVGVAAMLENVAAIPRKSHRSSAGYRQLAVLSLILHARGPRAPAHPCPFSASFRRDGRVSSRSSCTPHGTHQPQLQLELLPRYKD